MLETRTGLNAAERILAVEGVAGVLVGPFDLSLSLGVELAALLAADGQDDPLPSIVAAARRTGTRAGVFAGDPKRAERLRDVGFEAVAVTTASALLAHGASVVLGTAATGRTALP